MQIKPIIPADSGQLHRLWTNLLGSKWPISAAALAATLAIGSDEDKSLLLGLWQKRSLCGVVAAELTGAASAALLFLAVDSAYQRQGLASRLMDELKKLLAARGVQDISLGAGAEEPLWHGVPASLPAACQFFGQAGFVFEEEMSYDLIQDISKFQAPAGVFRCRDDHSVDFQALHRQDTAAIAKMLAFEREYFPAWHGYFEDAVVRKRSSDIVIAKRGDEIIGTALLSAGSDCPGEHWQELLGPKLGAFGTLGVAPRQREHGIGLALAAFVTETLRDRGVRNCFLHWTGLRDWYARLGYRVLEEYQMGTFQLREGG